MEKMDMAFDQLEHMPDSMKVYVLMQILDHEATRIAKDLPDEVKNSYTLLRDALLLELSDELSINKLVNKLCLLKQTEKQSVTDFYGSCRDFLLRVYDREQFPNEETRHRLMLEKFIGCLINHQTRGYLIASNITTVKEACDAADKYEYKMKQCTTKFDQKPEQKYSVQ
jgi:hypothetical protein